MSKSKKRNKSKQIKRTVDSSTASIQGAFLTNDSYSNTLANLGFGSNNLSQTGGYVLTRFTWDYQTLNALYRNNWIATAIIDKPAQEMLKNGFEIHSEVEPDLINRITSCWNRTRTREKFLELIRWSRLYGGAILIPLIEGQEDLSQPLDYDDIQVNSYKGCMVIDRWSGVSPSLEVVTDIASPEFGLPLFYIVSDYTLNKTYHVHHSRVIRMTGRDLPYFEKLAETFWGASELEHVFNELKKRDDTSANIAFLIFLANIRVFKMQDLGQALTLGDQQAMQTVYNTARSQNQLMCNTGTFMMDKDDEFEMHQYTFTGLNDIYESFMLDVSGAAEIPVTKLFGRSPAGMNSTGEGDLQNYYDKIQEDQESKVRYPLEKLLKIITMSEIGKIPDDWDLVFSPVRRPSDLEKADIAQKYAQPIFEAYATGIIDLPTTLKELKQQQKLTSMWSNITDDMIKNAEEELKEQKEKEKMEGIELEKTEEEISESGDFKTEFAFEKGNNNPKKQ